MNSIFAKHFSKKTTEEIIFTVVAYTFLLFWVALCVLPFINVISRSFSSNAAVMAGKVGLWPIGFNWDSYIIVLQNPQFFRSLFASVFITVVGTVLNTFFTIVVAYAISRQNLKGKNVISFLYVFTMLFSGGIIPTFLVIKDAGLLNTPWALILPGLVTAFNLIILRNYFYAIPESLEESAKMDGAHNLTILFRIMVPLAMPGIATVALFCAVNYWNSFFEALMYINTPEWKPLQIFLREAISNTNSDNIVVEALTNVTQESVRGSTVVLSTLPILLVYPFLQRYFVTGAMAGAVKQ